MVSRFHVVGIVVPLIAFSQTQALSLQRYVEGSTWPSESSNGTNLVESTRGTRTCPSMFVAVVSSLDNAQRRNEIRSMWTTAGQNYDSPLVYKYVLCTRGPKGWADGAVTQALRQEQDEFGDLIFMDCDEGYLDGLLTRKVAESMREYLHTYSNMDLYMKIDDDTFISTDMLCDLMDSKAKTGINLHRAYFGVFYEGNEHMTQKHPVIRDKESQWFEPWSKYADSEDGTGYYPIAAKGGPGYILPKDVVATIIHDGIDKNFELNNEDKAVGYWVKIYQRRQTWVKNSSDHITYVNIPGTDGYEEHEQWIKKKGPWNKYPHVLHHHLDGTTISCLHEVEFSKDPETLIGPCFTQTLFAKREIEHVRIHMPY